MRIHEIITENQTEGVDSLVTRLAKAPLKAIGKFFGSDRDELVTTIADYLARRGKWKGAATPAEAYKIAKGLGPAAQQLVKNDPQILADAARQANKVRNPSVWDKLTGASKRTPNSANVAAIKGSMATIGGWADALRKVYIGAMLVEPLLAYYDIMQDAQKLLDSGQVTADNFEKYHRREIAVLIGKWTSIIVVNWALQKPGKWLGLVFGVFSKTLGSFFTNIVGKGAGLAAVAVVTDKAVAQDIANFMASSIFGQAVGYLGVYSEDKLLSIFSDKLKYGPNGTATDAGQGAKTSDGSTTPGQDIGASSQPPSGSGSTSPNKIASEFDRPLFKDFK
jgi:hypothetical protein